MSTPAADEGLPEVRFPQRFTVRRYVPDGGMSFGGGLQFVGLLGLAGIMMGGIASFVSRFFYFVLLFPIGIGLCIGWVGSRCIRAFKIRRPLTCGVAGFVAGCLAMLSMHHFDYQRFLSLRAEEFGEDLPALQTIARNAAQIKAAPEEIPAEAREGVLELIRELETNDQFRGVVEVDSLWSYIDFNARKGVELKRGAGKGRGGNLGYTGSYIYWGVEALIVAGIAFAVMKGEAAQPFCGECVAWKQGQSFGPLSHPDAIRTAIGEGEIVQFEFDPTAEGTVEVLVFRCPHCLDEGEIDVRVEQLSVNSKGEVQRKRLTQMTYPPEAYEGLAAACTPLTRSTPLTEDTALSAPGEEAGREGPADEATAKEPLA